MFAELALCELDEHGRYVAQVGRCGFPDDALRPEARADGGCGLLQLPRDAHGSKRERRAARGLDSPAGAFSVCETIRL